MRQEGFIKYFVIIAAILVVLFLSQQAFFRGAGKSLSSGVSGTIGAYLAKGLNWASSNVYPKITGEVQNRGAMLNAAVSQEKQKVSENILTKVGNYFSGIEKAIVNPWTPQNCFSSVQTPSLNP